VAARDRSGTVCVAPSPCGVRRLVAERKRRPEHVLLHAHALRVHPLRAEVQRPTSKVQSRLCRSAGFFACGLMSKPMLVTLP